MVGKLMVEKVDVEEFVERMEMNIKGKKEAGEKILGVVRGGKLVKGEKVVFEMKEKYGVCVWESG